MEGAVQNNIPGIDDCGEEWRVIAMLCQRRMV